MSAVVLEKNDELFISLCAENGIKNIICSTPKEKAHIEKIQVLEPELILATGYSKIMPSSLLDIPRYGILNAHGGKLPEYRGASPIPWQIINGELGNNFFYLQD